MWGNKSSHNYVAIDTYLVSVLRHHAMRVSVKSSKMMFGDFQQLEFGLSGQSFQMLRNEFLNPTNE